VESTKEMEFIKQALMDIKDIDVNFLSSDESHPDFANNLYKIEYVQSSEVKIPCESLNFDSYD